jgi:hypothetical protein
MFISKKIGNKGSGERKRKLISLSSSAINQWGLPYLQQSSRHAYRVEKCACSSFLLSIIPSRSISLHLITTAAIRADQQRTHSFSSDLRFFISLSITYHIRGGEIRTHIYRMRSSYQYLTTNKLFNCSPIKSKRGLQNDHM